jgi:hypothetical protein
VINKLNHYKAEVDRWKEEKYTVIGYARKLASPVVTSELRVKSLQAMIGILEIFGTYNMKTVRSQ